MMFPPNYWALPGNVFPLAIMSAGAFGISSGTLSIYGVDAFSVGLFVAFFLGHGGIFDTKFQIRRFHFFLFFPVSLLFFLQVPSSFLSLSFDHFPFL